MSSTSDPAESSSRFAGLLSLLREHSGLALTIAYILLSTVGVCFKFALFSQFGINLFDFSDVNDFLIAGLRHPETFLFTILSLVLLRFAIALDVATQRRFPRYQPKHSGHSWQSITINTACVVLYFAVFVLVYSGYVAQQIRLGSGTKVVVDAPGLENASLQLVGTTSRFAVLYDADARVSHVFPVEQISRLRYSLPTREEPKK